MVIEDDVYDIVWELRRIDPCYRVERREGAFWLFAGKTREPEMKLPFDRLDMRTVRHVRKTRIERMDALLKEMERENSRLERESMRAARDAAIDGFKEAEDAKRYEKRGM